MSEHWSDVGISDKTTVSNEWLENYTTGYRKMQTRIKALEAVAEAVMKLPVEEMVERDNQGDPFLVGYCMQAQGEWDNVTQALRASGYLVSK